MYLSTDYLDIYFPGMVDKFGSSLPVTIIISHKEAPKVTLLANKLRLEVNFEMTVLATD